jgi:hypothetical protein
MAFYDILDQVITLLQQRGRASYRALKVQFHLDDESLEALKEELLYAYAVRDDEGRGLVWTGATASVKEAVAQPTQLIPQPVAQEQPSPEGLPRVPASSPPDAERRQLTVMFCDLVEGCE